MEWVSLLSSAVGLAQSAAAAKSTLFKPDDQKIINKAVDQAIREQSHSEYSQEWFEECLRKISFEVSHTEILKIFANSEPNKVSVTFAQRVYDSSNLDQQDATGRGKIINVLDAGFRAMFDTKSFRDRVFYSVIGSVLSSQEKHTEKLDQIIEKLQAQGYVNREIIEVVLRAERLDLDQTWLAEIIRNILDQYEGLSSADAQAEFKERTNRAFDFLGASANSNEPPEMQIVYTQAQKLFAEGQFEKADQVIADFEKDKDAQRAQERIQSNKIRLDMAIAADNVPLAADLAFAMTRDEEGAEKSEWELLRNAQNLYYDLGQNNPAPIYLEIAIELCARLVKTARDDQDRAASWVNYGRALATLGDREGDPTRLQIAVQTFENALETYSKENTPLDWAGMQMNLGNALQILGERAGDPKRLESAVKAFENALEIYSKENTPLEWAATQMNLGNALRSLGDREGDPKWLESAVKAFENALEIYSKAKTPLEWAMTHNNLGNALQSLGEREGDTKRLESAVKAFENALEIYSKEKTPLDWAGAQNNLGTALLSLGGRAGDPKRLESAVKAFENALEIYSKETRRFNGR